MRRSSTKVREPVFSGSLSRSKTHLLRVFALRRFGNYPGRERKQNEALANQIFSRNRRQSAPVSTQPGAGPSLASRVGVKKVRFGRILVGPISLVPLSFCTVVDAAKIFWLSFTREPLCVLTSGQTASCIDDTRRTSFTPCFRDGSRHSCPQRRPSRAPGLARGTIIRSGPAWPATCPTRASHAAANKPARACY